MARLGAWSGPTSPRPLIPPAPASPPVESRRIERELTQATVSLARPGIRQDHPDYFPLVVANYILGGGSASRLYTKVREERGLAYSVYSGLGPGRYGASYFVGLQGNQVAIFKGRPGGLLWIQPTVTQRTALTTSTVLPARVPDLRAGKEEPSLAAAQQYVGNLAQEASSLPAGTPGGPAATATTAPPPGPRASAPIP